MSYLRRIDARARARTLQNVIVVPLSLAVSYQPKFRLPKRQPRLY